MRIMIDLYYVIKNLFQIHYSFRPLEEYGMSILYMTNYP